MFNVQPCFKYNCLNKKIFMRKKLINIFLTNIYTHKKAKQDKKWMARITLIDARTYKFFTIIYHMFLMRDKVLRLKILFLTVGK